eukprot:g12630.t1
MAASASSSSAAPGVASLLAPTASASASEWYEEQAFATMSMQRDVLPLAFSDAEVASALKRMGAQGQLDDVCVQKVHAAIFSRQKSHAEQRQYMALHDAFASSSKAGRLGPNMPVGIFGLQSAKGAALNGCVGWVLQSCLQPRTKHTENGEERRPNCQQRVFADTPSIVALRKIGPGEQLTICYAGEAVRQRPAAERRAWLQDKYNFACACELCAFELGSEVRGQ